MITAMNVTNVTAKKEKNTSYQLESRPLFFHHFYYLDPINLALAMAQQTKYDLSNVTV